MCISPRPASDSPEPELVSWLPRAPLAERQWAPLLRACLNRATPTNCAVLTAALRAAVGPRATRPDTLPHLVRDVLAHVSVSGLYGPQNAALCGALAELRSPDGQETFLDLLTDRCETAAVGEAAVEPAVRRHCAAFLGELYTAEVVPPERMWRWLARLEPRETETPDAERIDSLCALLSTGGSALDAATTAAATAAATTIMPTTMSMSEDQSEDRKAETPLDALFSRLSRLTAGAGLDTRLRCLLLDTVELRARGWRRRAHVACPQHIDELRAAVQEEAPTLTGRRRRRGHRRQPRAT